MVKALSYVGQIGILVGVWSLRVTILVDDDSTLMAHARKEVI